MITKSVQRKKTSQQSLCVSRIRIIDARLEEAGRRHSAVTGISCHILRILCSKHKAQIFGLLFALHSYYFLHHSHLSEDVNCTMATTPNGFRTPKRNAPDNYDQQDQPPLKKCRFDHFDPADFFDNERFSDIIIKCGDRQFKAHKLIVCNKSEYFNTAFGPESKFMVRVL